MNHSRENYLSIKSKLQSLVILTLILGAPPLVILFWFTNTSLDGSLKALWELSLQQGFFNLLSMVWLPVFFGSALAWKMLAVFAATQLLFMRLLPGTQFVGPISPTGNRPVYKANGVPAFALTLGLFILCSFQLKLFSPTIIYDNFGALLGALNFFSLLFCVGLLLKGLYAPSSADAGSSKNLIFDFYWGTELYPRVLGWDVKMFTNCRFAMMSWPLILVSFAAKQSELYGLSDSMVVAVALQLVYVAKFFYWETGYLSSLDIMHDRAGFYICWGCLVWVPGIYTSSTLYLVNHPNNLGMAWSCIIMTLGIGCILANYFADRQRQRVRRTSGQCTIWRNKPLLINVEYQTAKGERKESLLLFSGWWGISRHFHYVLELSAAFLWSVPALFDNVLPYFYFVYLTILLVERAYRDDKRCSDKYGKGWDEYCERVPYKIIPYVV